MNDYLESADRQQLEALRLGETFVDDVRRQYDRIVGSHAFLRLHPLHRCFACLRRWSRFGNSGRSRDMCPPCRPASARGQKRFMFGSVRHRWDVPFPRTGCNLHCGNIVSEVSEVLPSLVALLPTPGAVPIRPDRGDLSTSRPIPSLADGHGVSRDRLLEFHTQLMHTDPRENG